MKLNRQFWVSQLGEGWVKKLEPVLRSEYTIKLFKFLLKEYKSKTIYPEKKDIFKAFKLTPYENVRVVILGQCPYHQRARATGLAFANTTKRFSFSPSLVKIFECIEREVYDGLYMDFDWTLERWAAQGVFLLNTALTVEENKPGSHIKPWNKFTSETIGALSDFNSGLIFLLWGAEAKKYKHLISNNHYILEHEHPAAACYSRRDWKCPHFTEVNKILKNLNNEEIRW